MSNKTEIDPNRRGRGDAKLRTLPQAQRDKVDTWLFAEQLPHKAVAERCRTEFGLDVGTSSVQRYCRREKLGWEFRRQARADVQAMQERWPSISEPEAYYRALFTKVSEFVLGKAQDMENKENRAFVLEAAHLLVSARRAASIAHRGALARERYEFDAATECLKHQIEMAAIMQNKEMDDGDRVFEIRRQLFGNDLPK